MAQFSYKARSRSGQVKQGVLESVDRAGALSILQRDGLFPVSVQAAKAKGKPEGEVIVRLEAPRGELMYLVRGSGGKFLDRVRIKTPTFSGIPAMIEVLRGSRYADAPAILASFDPCMSCTAK